jgi:5-methylcytosine-specific restriction endonuclease McrA
MTAKSRNLFLTLLFVCPLFLSAAPVDDILVSLCDPAKLATLGERGANARVQKIVYWLETSQREGNSPQELMDNVMQRIGWNDERGHLTCQAMLRNLDIATKLGCTDQEGMEKMRHGHCAIVKTGPYAGDQLSVDHIVPRARYPQLDNVLANLELMPLRLNMKKGANFGQRQASELSRFEKAGFIRSTSQPDNTSPDKIALPVVEF